HLRRGSRDLLPNAARGPVRRLLRPEDHGAPLRARLASHAPVLPPVVFLARQDAGAHARGYFPAARLREGARRRGRAAVSLSAVAHSVPAVCPRALPRRRARPADRGARPAAVYRPLFHAVASRG